MRNPLTVAGAWSRKAFLVIKAYEDALDHGYGAYVQQRVEHLERRVAALENAQPQPRLPYPTSTRRMNP